MELARLASQVRASSESADGCNRRNAGSHALRDSPLTAGVGASHVPAGDSKKNFGHCIGSVEARYARIQEVSETYPVSELCELLGVARSGYYAWSKQVQTEQESLNEELTKRITELFAEHKRRYGSPRITSALKREGRRCNHKRVERLMRQQGLQARKKRRWRPRTTDSKHTNPIAPNRLQEGIQTTTINQVWIQDITYLPTEEGWLFLAGVLDLHSRRVIGWSMQETLETSLPLAALEMALFRRGFPAQVIHHSDRGCQYASREYRAVLQKHEFLASMSRKGNCYDNATMEAFWSSLKTELQDEHMDRLPKAEVRQLVFEYIESYYNRKRFHSSLNYQSPVEFELKLS
jgi:putative transposase